MHIDADRLAGNWKLVSCFTEDVETKRRNNVYGDRPSGYMGFTPAGRFFGLITADEPTAPQTPQDQAAAYRSMLAYTGKWTLDGDRFIVDVDAAWDKGWVGTKQVRYWRLEGNKLHITSAPIPNPNVAGSMMIGTVVWEKEQ
jgi:hypothetical protein